MSVLVAVRIPDELVAKLDKLTENRSATIVTALSEYLDKGAMDRAREPEAVRARSTRARPAAVEYKQDTQRLSGCSECGSLVSHQKGCSKRGK